MKNVETKLNNMIDYILKIVEDFDFNSVKHDTKDIGSIIVCEPDMKDFIKKFYRLVFNYKFFNAFCGYNHDIFNLNFTNCSLTVGYSKGDPMVFDMKFYPNKHVVLRYYVVLIYNTSVHLYFRQMHENNENYDIVIDEIYTPYISSCTSAVALLDMKDVECIPIIHTDVYEMEQVIFASYEIFEAFYNKMTSINPNIKFYITSRQAKHSLFCHRGNPKFPEYRKLVKKNFEIIQEGSKQYIRRKQK